MIRLLWFVVVAVALVSSATWSAEGDRVARVGVLAYRGTDRMAQNWVGLMHYLDGSVSGWRFEIVPVTLTSAGSKIDRGELDFLVTNPGHFVELGRSHALSAIASRRQQKSDDSFSGEFGSAIVVRAESSITLLSHARGLVIAAVDKNAFGGFQLAWREFDHAGIDIFSEAAALNFTGFPMDQVIFQVLDGKADIGIVRSGLVEQLAEEGLIDPAELRLLNASAEYTHPDGISTRLYPEWPFIAFPSTDADLRDRVALALLGARDSSFAFETGMRDIWSAPVSYRAAADLVSAYRARSAEPDTTPARLAPVYVAALALALFFALALGVLAWRRSVRAVSDPAETSPEPTHAPDDAHVTPREREILDLISRGHSTKEIARLLGISPKTVEFHRANLLKKFGARTSSQLVAVAT